jgi:HNH endonuclease
MPRTSPRTADYFWARVEKTETCWLWTGHVDKDGYGRVDGGMRASRYAYLLLVGPIPKTTPRLVIDHICRNPRCVNPKHLEAVTDRENVLRGSSPPIPHPQAERPTCIHGHPLSGANLRVDRRGWRKCLTCERERARAKNGVDPSRSRVGVGS